MTDEEYKAQPMTDDEARKERRRESNRKAQAKRRATAKKYKEELKKALEFIDRTPALRKQKNEEDHFNFANRVLDFGADTRKDLFALAKGDTFASRD